jgi:hypothetical protein
MIPLEQPETLARLMSQWLAATHRTAGSHLKINPH